jgi:hypothetical protein
MRIRWLLLSVAVVCASCAPPAAPPPAPLPGGGMSMNTVGVRLLSSNAPDIEPQKGKPTYIVLLVQQTGPNADPRRNEQACYAILGAIGVGPGPSPPSYERTIWWPDKRVATSLPTSIDCRDLVDNYDWGRANGLIARAPWLRAGTPAQVKGYGPYLLTMSKDANDNTIGWAIDCSIFASGDVWNVAGQWGSAIVNNQTDPTAVSKAVAAVTSGQQKVNSAAPPGGTFWSYFGTVWNWIWQNRTAVASAAVAVLKFVGLSSV